MGDYTAEDGETFPVYMHFEGDAHVADEERNRAWDEKTTWTVLDYKSAEGLATRIGADRRHRSIGFCWCVEFCPDCPDWIERWIHWASRSPT